MRTYRYLTRYDARYKGVTGRGHYRFVTGACSLAQDSVVVHLTTDCLTTNVSHLAAPVVSVPSYYAGGFGSSALHVSFAPTTSFQLPVLLAIAEKLEWTSAVYVGDTSEGDICSV